LKALAKELSDVGPKAYGAVTAYQSNKILADNARAKERGSLQVDVQKATDQGIFIGKNLYANC
jgi:hypothetical protein